MWSKYLILSNELLLNWLVDLILIDGDTYIQNISHTYISKLDHQYNIISIKWQMTLKWFLDLHHFFVIILQLLTLHLTLHLALVQVLNLTSTYYNVCVYFWYHLAVKTSRWCYLMTHIVIHLLYHIIYHISYHSISSHVKLCIEMRGRPNKP